MFRASVNPYDEPVAKTTDENLTGENWELILNLCDKVTDEGEQGARNVMAAVLKRLAHRNPNVQLYSLALTESLSKNCGVEVNREIASRSFTQGLERLVTDRTTHEKVKKRTLALIQQWASEFEHDPSLGIMEECYQNLKAKNYKFDHTTEAPPPEVDDSIRRKEEEELQRVLELSMQDKGGRDRWFSDGYAASGGAGSSRNGSSANLPGGSGGGSSAAAATSKPAASTVKPVASPTANKPHQQPQPQAAPAYTSSGYTPSAATQAPAATTTPTPTLPQSTTSPKPNEQTVSRVRALHTFEPTELGELAFEKGDIIKVVDRQFKDWWRGQLKGKTGIFPVNYVEPLPEPTPADLAKEAQMEVEVFSQAASIDRLLAMLKGLDPLKDNLSDNDDLQELYRQSVALRPKIVKLLDKYTQKRIELTNMNDNFKTARQMFETMMEESLAKHNPGVTYDYRQPPRQGYEGYGTQSVYGWNPSLVQQQGPQPAQSPYYGPQPPPGQYGPQDYVQPYGPAPPVDPHSAYAQQYQQYAQQAQPPPAPYQPDQQHQQQQQQAQGYPQQAYAGYPQQPQQQPQQQIPGQPQPGVTQQQPQQQAVPGQQPYGQPVQPQTQATPTVQQTQQQQQAVPQQQGYAQAIQQLQAQHQQTPTQQPQAQAQAQAQPQPQPQQVQGYPTGPVPGGPQRQASLGFQPTSPGTPGSAPVEQQVAQPQYAAQQQQQQPYPVQQQQPQQAAVTAQPLQVQAQPLPGQVQSPEQQPAAQPQAQDPAQAQPQPQAQAQAQPQQQEPQRQQTQSQPQQGPPYVWSPNGQYPDPGAQAWAAYYAQGGTDPAGRVYFTPESLPPVPDANAPAVAVTSATPI